MASYIPSTKEERLEMLKAIGLNDYNDLYKDVPASMLLKDGGRLCLCGRPSALAQVMAARTEKRTG